MSRRSALFLAPLAAVAMLAAAQAAGPVASSFAGLPFAGPRADLTPKDQARVDRVTKPTTDFSAPERFESMSGGAGTSKKAPNADAFSHFATNITFEEEELFKLGNALFRKFWVSSPSSTQASDGLGPLFNARSCQSCHLKDGRGRPPEGGDAVSMFLRLARAPVTAQERDDVASHRRLNLPDPTYGEQLQAFAVPGLKAEGRMSIAYVEESFAFADETTVFLRRPDYAVHDLADGSLDPATTLSPRVANPMIGMGLIQAIEPGDILTHADPDDADGDGISGRPAIVRDHRSQALLLGRFGWKAQNGTIRDQVSSAFAGDIGISTPDVPRAQGDCTDRQVDCQAMPNGVQPRLGDTEAPDPVMDLVTFYSENLAVPQRRGVGEVSVLQGKDLFYGAGCPACHVPKYVTSRDAANSAQAFQLIWPYSDFLLHDMGEGLSDGQMVGEATGLEWRTPPLWGIGLTETVSGHRFFLHDGRARNLTEAILWHGGEAEAARDAFAAMPAPDRALLIRFLESL